MATAKTKIKSDDVRLHHSRITLDTETRRQVVGLLNQHLAATLDLYTQVKQAHWNVKGIEFYQLHKLFDEIAEEIFPFIDLVAERVTALGGTATGTTRMAAQNSFLPEMPADTFEGRALLECVRDRLADYGGSVREGIDQTDEAGDQGTADLLTDLIRVVDEQLYFVEAHLQLGDNAGE